VRDDCKLSTLPIEREQKLINKEHVWRTVGEPPAGEKRMSLTNGWSGAALFVFVAPVRLVQAWLDDGSRPNGIGDAAFFAVLLGVQAVAGVLSEAFRTLDVDGQ